MLPMRTILHLHWLGARISTVGKQDYDAAEDDKYHEIIDKAELFLPGEEALLTNYKVDMLEAGGMVVSCKSFGVMLENLWKQDRVIYIVADSEEDVENLRNYCKKNQPELKVAGDCVYSEEIEDAAIVNLWQTKTDYRRYSYLHHSLHFVL